MTDSDSHSPAGLGGFPRHAGRAVRFGFRVVSRAATSAASWSRRHELKVHRLLVGSELEPKVDVKPVADIPAPIIDLQSVDPLAAIAAAPEFQTASGFFADNPVASRSLLSPQAQALLYCLLRNLKPDHVFEIGCFQAGTTEAICRALHANGKGLAHTVDPFQGDVIKAVLKHWPPELLQRVRLYTTDSMPFYWEQETRGIRPGLVFVDGNHEYEYARFDIGCAARALLPGGLIFVDDIGQVGPFFAGRDFLATNPGWRELGSSARDYDRTKSYDPHRTTIPGTNFMVLQAPTNRLVGDRPANFGTISWNGNRVSGLRVKFQPSKQTGVLYVQTVLRGFGVRLAETYGETTAQVSPGTSEISVAFTPAIQVTGQFATFTAEPWLIWQSEEPLRLVGLPELH